MGVVYRGMGLASRYSRTTLSILASSSITRSKAKVDSSMRMAMHMKDSGKTIRPMDLECICIEEERSTKVFGRRICRKDREFRSGMMAADIKANTKMGRSMGRAHTFGLMVVIMWVLGVKITFMGLGSITGRMADRTLASGAKTKCMAKACILGRTVESIREDIKMIKSTAMASIFGQTVVNSKENGSMGREVGKGRSSIKKDRSKKVFGMMIRD